jgi:hypothetical protein
MEDEYEIDDFTDFENGLDIDLNDFNVDEILFDDVLETRYLKPPRTKQLSEYRLKFDDAKKLAKHINLTDIDRRYFVVVTGSFIFGDFIEALLIQYNYHVKTMTISTLGLSQNNIDSLCNLMKANYIDELNMITSCYFFSHERSALVKYMYEKLDYENKFQYAVADSHTKMILIETHCGKYLVIHGSANLRSSGCLEQFVIEDCKQLYDFNMEYQSMILERFSTIDKMVRGKELHHLVINGVSNSTVKSKRIKKIKS